MTKPGQRPEQERRGGGRRAVLLASFFTSIGLIIGSLAQMYNAGSSPNRGDLLRWGAATLFGVAGTFASILIYRHDAGREREDGETTPTIPHSIQAPTAKASDHGIATGVQIVEQGASAVTSQYHGITVQQLGSGDINVTQQPSSRATSQAEPIWNIPPPVLRFTARDAELETLHRALTSTGEAGRAALIPAQALYGPGGIGKTQLARAYGYRYRDEFDLAWWIPAEQDVAIRLAFEQLARELGLPGELKIEVLVSKVRAELERRDRWLIIFDNVRRPQALDGYLPRPGNGQIIITSRNPAFAGLATPVELRPFDLESAAAFLQARTNNDDQSAAIELAEELDGLPLALEQAAGYMDSTALGLREYLYRFRLYRDQMLAAGTVTAYHGTVDTTVRLSAQQAIANCPAAEDFLSICSFMVPDDIPISILTDHSDRELLGESLSGLSEDDTAVDKLLGALYEVSLLAREQGSSTLRIHRLTQAVIASGLPQPERLGWIDSILTRVIRLGGAGVPDFRGYHEEIKVMLEDRYGEAPETAVALRAIGIRETSVMAGLYLNRSLAILRNTYGPIHIQTGVTLAYIGQLYRAAGNNDTAHRLFQQALDIFELLQDADAIRWAIELLERSTGE
jgi:tetratricopeptide (TPR) repeat protein